MGTHSFAHLIPVLMNPAMEKYHHIMMAGLE